MWNAVFSMWTGDRSPKVANSLDIPSVSGESRFSIAATHIFATLRITQLTEPDLASVFTDPSPTATHHVALKGATGNVGLNADSLLSLKE
jgi:hypothetical protein